jgi:hypothetical protein
MTHRRPKRSQVPLKASDRRQDGAVFLKTWFRAFKSRRTSVEWYLQHRSFSSHFENISDAHSFTLVLNRFLSSLFGAVSHSPSCGHALVKTAFSVWFIEVLESGRPTSGDIRRERSANEFYAEPQRS